MSTRLDLSKLSLMDALDLAKLIEMEACHRYQMFASQLGHSGGYDAGAFFASVAENEAKHGQEQTFRKAGMPSFQRQLAAISGRSMLLLLSLFRHNR